MLVAKGFTVIALCLGPTEIKGAHVLVVDLTKYEEVNRVVIPKIQKLAPEGVFALFNNAGIAIPGDSLILRTSDFTAVMDVCFHAAVNLTLGLLPLLIRARGRIVNMGSIDSFTPMPGNGPYDAAKHALEAWTSVLRIELKPRGIQVVSILPGTTDTEILKEFKAHRRRVWDASPDDRKLYYVDDYIEQETKNLDTVLDTIKQPMPIVNKAIEEAITSVHPKHRYYPGWMARNAYIISLLPFSWGEGILYNTVVKPCADKSWVVPGPRSKVKNDDVRVPGQDQAEVPYWWLRYVPIFNNKK
jgi:short-subunit dehydrogenase